MSTHPADRTTRRRFLSLGAGFAAGTTLASCRASTSRTGEDGEDSSALDTQAEERFPELSNSSGELEPISVEERAARRARCAGLLAGHGLDALIVEPGATMTYLAGVEWGLSERLFALVVLADGGAFWIVPGFEVERARRRIEAAGAPSEIVPWQEHEYPFQPLAAELRARRVERVAAEPALRAHFVFGIAQALERPTLESGAELVVELRGRKDAHELALLRRANELTQQALSAAHERLRPGMRSAEIARLVRAAQRKLGLTGVWDLTLIGPDAALPHGGSGDAVIGRGDVLLVDTGGQLHGYQSDCTRTWVPFGRAPRDFERVWQVVHDAQAAAFAALRPGVECRTIDAVARAVIGAAGFGESYETFTHRLGHGIGLEGHEAPYLDGGSRVILAPGMTCSDEPGVYLTGRFGCRIEDIVAVSEEGADHFGSWQREPTSPA